MPFVENSGGGGGSGTVTSVTATDTSIVVAGTAVAPTLATGTLDVIATNHAPAANWSNNSKKLTALANGTLATDAAAFGQIPDGSDGQAGLLGPSCPGWSSSAIAYTANRLIASRFVPVKAITVANMRFRSVGAGTNNIDIGIIDSAGNRLGSSGSTSGKKGANTNQTVALTGTVALVAGTVYYLCIVSDTSDGTYLCASLASSGYESFWGTTLGLVLGFQMSAAFPIPTTVTVGAVNTAPALIAVTT